MAARFPRASPFRNEPSLGSTSRDPRVTINLTAPAGEYSLRAAAVGLLPITKIVVEPAGGSTVL